MKKNSLIVCVLFTHAFFSQTPSENYIESRTYLEPVTSTSNTAKQARSIQYLDGLGRPKQIVNVKATPLGKDLVTHVEYDHYGNQAKDFLPIPQTGTQNGAIYTSPLANASAFYGNEKIFSELIFENSHLNRLKQKIHEGNSWSSNPIKYDYDTNVVGEVIKYSSESIWSNGTTSSNLKILGFFSPNQLYKNSVTDEDGNPKIIYSTLENKIVLIRKPLSPTQNIDTYYVYDEYNNLTFIIQPKGVEATKNLPPNTDISSTVKYELTYQYKYDERRRVVEKKNPGDAWSYMIYDKQDRLVATRNDILRSQGKWQFLQYDQLGRIAYTGLAYGGKRAEVQQTVDLLNGYHVIRSSTAISHSNIDIYYSAPTPVYPSQNHWDKILTVNYYDTYPPGAPNIPIQILDQDVLQSSQSNIVSTKSLPTAAFVNIVEDDSWTKTYSWYDKKGRVIGSLSNNFLGGYTKTEMLLDFVGNVLQNNTYHKRLPSENETRVSETFEYDDLNRLLILKNKINNGPIEYLTQNGYNELGELTRKKVGGSSLGNHLQEENYLYNIRGWLSSVNDPNNLGADIFGYKIRYNNVEGLEHPDASDILLKVIPKYNGNIAEIDWKTSTEENEPLKRYGYVYDAQNRLLAGFYQKSTNPSAREFYEKVTYDLNGNISTIKRTGRQISPTSSLQIDNLIYQYYDNNLSNKLKTISETTQINSGYPYVPMPTDIVYDNSGNMISFNDKQISDIQYNFLNLPKQISKGTQITNLIYRVDGIKVKKTYNTLETIYLDGFQHKSTYPSEFDGYIDPSQTPQTRLRIIPTSEGYYDVLKQLYVYNFTDHLGNVRVSYADSNQDGIIQTADLRIRHCQDMGGGNMACYDYFEPGETVEVNNYYPFGLLHDYQITSDNPYQYKYQGQELQENGFYSFKWRNYMPDVGRFFNTDPLSEKYTYQSHYNFSENRVVDALELEGLENINLRDLSDQERENLMRELAGNRNAPYEMKESLIEEVTITKYNAIATDSQSFMIRDIDWEDIGRTALNFTPAGDALDIYEGFRDGNWMQAGSGIVFLGLGLTTGGASSVLKGGAKTLLKEGIGDLVQEGIEHEVKAIGKGLTEAAAKGSTTVFKSFTKSNFRHNLGQLTGNIPANSQAHHVFPQKFQSIFSSKGINIHDPKFGAWWQTSGHLKNASGYNAAWESFLRTNPSQSQIMNYGRQLMGQYGIPVGF